MRSAPLILLLFSVCFSVANAAKPAETFNVYLIRHAEKQQDDSHDPLLSEKGLLRAEKLSAWFKKKSINDIWSSDYRRTRATAEPLLESLGKQVMIYNPRELNVLTEQLLDKRNNALVVGHSNTTPELARLLCACQVEPMQESEYDRLLIVSFEGQKPTLRTLLQSQILE